MNADFAFFSLAEHGSPLFRWVSLAIFVIAVIHILFANCFTQWGERVQEAFAKKHEGSPKEVSFAGEILHFLGEIEIIFALWVIPLLAVIFFFYNWDVAVNYLEERVYIEPLFVIVIMSLASTKPIVTLAENGLKLVARMLGGSCWSWWLVILTIGPLFGSFITEAGAMTLCALLLARRFYAYAPSKKLAYATLGLLFVNISVGGLLTNFAAPPVLIVQRIWDWSSLFVLTNFGIKAMCGIFVVNALYFLFFHKELVQLEKIKHLADFEDEKKVVGREMPIWIIIIHLLFLFCVIYNAHYPPIFIGAFLLFLGFHQATTPHQFPMHLKRPLLVGLFLAGLLIHGGLQGWWIVPLLGSLSSDAMMFLGMALTAMNDNAAVTYLATLVPDLTDQLKYSIMSGVVVGGGLTVIANAPNPAGQVILKKFFKGKISPLYLLIGAAFPTAVFYLIFYFLPPSS